MVLSTGRQLSKKDIPMGFDSPDGKTWCVECEREIATKFCGQCEEPFCNNCFEKIHQKGKRKDHTFTLLDKAAQEEEKRIAAEAQRAEQDKQQQIEEVLEGWERHVDSESRQAFWHNPTTGDTTWDNPANRAEEILQYQQSLTGIQEFAAATTAPAEANAYTDEAYTDPMYTDSMMQQQQQMVDPMADAMYGDPMQPMAGVDIGNNTWTMHFDEDSQMSYWHNPSTGETTWDQPMGF